MYKGESYHLDFAARKGRTILSGGYKAAICIGNTCRASDTETCSMGWNQTYV